MSPAPVAWDAVTLNRGVDGLTWRGDIKNGSFQQTAADLDGGTRMVLEITAKDDLPVDGVSYRLEFPRASFLGGRASLDGGAAICGVQKPAGRELLGGVSRSVEMRSSRGIAFTASFDRILPVRIEDRWDRNGRFYAATVEFHHGALAAG